MTAQPRRSRSRSPTRMRARASRRRQRRRWRARIRDRRGGVRRAVDGAGRRRLRHRLEPRAADRAAPRASAAACSAADFVRVVVGAAADARRPARGWRRRSIALARRRRARGARAPRSGSRVSRLGMTPSMTSISACPSSAPACGCTSTRTPAAARRRSSRRSRGAVAEDVGDLSRLRRRVDDACARYLGVDPAQLRADQRPRRRHPAAAIAYLQRDPGAAAGADAASARRLIVPSRRSRCTPTASTAVGGARRLRAAAARTSRSRSTTCWRAITPTHAHRLPDQPEQPDRPADSARRRCTRSRARAPDATGVRRRGVRRLPRRALPRRAARRTRTSSSAGRSRRPTAWPGCASASRRDAGDARRRCAGRCRSTASTSSRSRRSRRRSAIARTSTWYLAQVARVEGAALRRVRAARAALLEERRPTSCWSTSATRADGDRRRRCAQRGIFVRDRSSEPGCAGCIRITAGVVEHTAQRASRRWRRSCAPRA